MTKTSFSLLFGQKPTHVFTQCFFFFCGVNREPPLSCGRYSAYIVTEHNNENTKKSGMSLHYSSKTPVNSQGITNLYKPPPKEMKASPSNAVAICPRPTTITPTSRKILPGAGVKGGGGLFCLTVLRAQKLASTLITCRRSEPGVLFLNFKSILALFLL